MSYCLKQYVHHLRKIQSRSDEDYLEGGDGRSDVQILHEVHQKRVQGEANAIRSTINVKLPTVGRQKHSIRKRSNQLKLRGKCDCNEKV